MISMSKYNVPACVRLVFWQYNPGGALRQTQNMLQGLYIPFCLLGTPRNIRQLLDKICVWQKSNSGKLPNPSLMKGYLDLSA